MVLDPVTLKALAIEMAAAMPPPPPREVVLVPFTGEAVSVDALRLARLYDQASSKQQRALYAIVDAMGEV